MRRQLGNGGNSGASALEDPASCLAQHMHRLRSAGLDGACFHRIYPNQVANGSARVAASVSTGASQGLVPSAQVKLEQKRIILDVDS